MEYLLLSCNTENIVWQEGLKHKDALQFKKK